MFNFKMFHQQLIEFVYLENTPRQNLSLCIVQICHLPEKCQNDVVYHNNFQRAVILDFFFNHLLSFLPVKIEIWRGKILADELYLASACLCICECNHR